MDVRNDLRNRLVHKRAARDANLSTNMQSPTGMWRRPEHPSGELGVTVTAPPEHAQVAIPSIAAPPAPSPP
jgi:hypothetical protein